MFSLARGRPAWRTGVRGGIALAIALLTTALFAAPVEADGVIPMTLGTLSDYAGQVIGGEVVSVRSYWAEGPRRIESEVVFQNVEYLKGRLPDSKATFSLVVPGGTVGDWQMQIGCAPKFAVGERWVLFLLPTYKTFPIVGLHQGAFRVEPDADGVGRVYDASGGAVVSLGEDGFFRSVSRSADASSPQVSRTGGRPGARASAATQGAPVAVEGQSPAQGDLLSANRVRVQLVGRPSVAPQVVSYDAFVAMIRPFLERSKGHNLTSPAGQRDVSPYVPVPMKQAVPSGGASEAPPSEAGLRSGGAVPRKVDTPRPTRAQRPGADEKGKEVRR